MDRNFAKTIELTNTYIVLTTPLILFSLISNLYFLMTASSKIINLLIGLILLFLMSGAFIAGWLRMMKDAIAEEAIDNPNAILKNFVSGVGEYFLSSLGGIIVSLLIFTLVSTATYHIGMSFIGDPNINPEAFKEAVVSTTQLKAFLGSLSEDQITKFSYWNILLFTSINIFYFILFLFFPAIFYKNKNPFLALFLSFKDLFSKKFFKTLGLFITIIAIYLIITFLTAIFNGNTIIYFIMTLVNFYFLTAAVVGIFYYYNQNFVKTQIGQNVDLTI